MSSEYFSSVYEIFCRTTRLRSYLKSRHFHNNRLSIQYSNMPNIIKIMDYRASKNDF